MNSWDKDIPAQVMEEIETLYMECRNKIFLFVHSKIRDEDIAEDITQEAFLEAMRHYEIFSRHTNKIGWLFRVAHYKMCEYYRRLNRIEKLLNEEKIPEAGKEEEGYSRLEWDIVLQDILTPEEQLRFKRYFVWGEGIMEIAQKEQISYGNMRVRLSRLRSKIVQAMGEITKNHMGSDRCDR